ncbi:MAG: cyclic lactone autoinducer peptide [Eubacteriales bacterium]|nr:cyclic lactone autoinducer peptide [Eubacteriales bacterium]
MNKKEIERKVVTVLNYVLKNSANSTSSTWMYEPRIPASLKKFKSNK